MMLKSLLLDFLSLQDHEVITTIDHRLRAKLRLPQGCRVVEVRGDGKGIFCSLVEKAEAVLIIAPETDSILADLTALVEERGKLLLGSSREAVIATGDKAIAYQRLSGFRVPTPETYEIPFCEDPFPAIEHLGYPVVVKPIDGVGCQGVFVVRKEEEVQPAISALKRETTWDRFLLQRYIEGVHASVSLIGNGQEALPLTLNAQEIRGRKRLRYRGGLTPLQHRLQPKAFENVQGIPSAIKGLKGYFGVDVVLAEDEAFVIEVNPRLTTSYVGVRKVVKLNLASAILNASQGSLPEEVPLTGRARFST
ncbi:MAG: ATP-grasp domain-containing protein [Candidatus Methylomirabilales bacterium]